MNKRAILTAVAAAVASVCSVTPSHAKEHGLYVGAGIGEASLSYREFDDSDTAFKLFGGLAFEYLALELAYIDAGTQNDTLEGFNVESSSDAFIVSLLPTLPLGEHFALFGKIGYAFYETDETVTLGNLRASESDTNEDLWYGAGVAFYLGTKLTVRAEYEVADVPVGDFDTVSLNAIIRF